MVETDAYSVSAWRRQRARDKSGALAFESAEIFSSVPVVVFVTTQEYSCSLLAGIDGRDDSHACHFRRQPLSAFTH